ncbi:hypothetical protein L1887_10764 [Cichorium endivia]|nr:hypothetical protein L1887_10764 [Cichorium endivia]
MKYNTSTKKLRQFSEFGEAVDVYAARKKDLSGGVGIPTTRKSNPPIPILMKPVTVIKEWLSESSLIDVVFNLDQFRHIPSILEADVVHEFEVKYLRGFVHSTEILEFKEGARIPKGQQQLE